MLPEQDAFFEQLYRENYKKMTFYALAALKNPSRAEEVVQDAFHEAIKKTDVLMEHENPGGWLMQTVKYKIHESERAHIRHLKYFLSLDTDIPIELAAPDLPNADIHETSDTIQKIKAALTEDELYLLKRIIFEKASHLDMAKELGITVWTSQKRLERIRKKLHQVFPDKK